MTRPEPGGRVWLDVPFAEKDAAKAAGARWDPEVRRWFAPRPGMAAMQQWAAIPEALPGEDRSFGSGLFVDLVPASCWFTNVRSCVDARDWDRLRRRVYSRAQWRCEICGAVPDRDHAVWLEAHERWDYLDDVLVQRLTRLICLCNGCHEVTHFGFAQLQGNDARALDHLMRVTGSSRQEAEAHVRQAFRLWERRSLHDWTLDLSVLTDAGIRVVDAPTPRERRAAGRRGLPEHGDPATPAAVTALPARGWYPDPAKRYPLRWWNGDSWTKWVAQQDRKAARDPHFPD